MLFKNVNIIKDQNTGTKTDKHINGSILKNNPAQQHGIKRKKPEVQRDNPISQYSTLAKNVGSGARMPGSPNPGSESNQLYDLGGQESYLPFASIASLLRLSGLNELNS